MVGIQEKLGYSCKAEELEKRITVLSAFTSQLHQENYHLWLSSFTYHKYFIQSVTSRVPVSLNLNFKIVTLTLQVEKTLHSCSDAYW